MLKTESYVQKITRSVSAMTQEGDMTMKETIEKPRRTWYRNFFKVSEKEISVKLNAFHRMQSKNQVDFFSSIANLIEKGFIDGAIEDTEKLRWQIRFFKTTESDMLTHISEKYKSSKKKFTVFVNQLRLIDRNKEKEFVQTLGDQEHATIKERFDSLFTIIQKSLSLVLKEQDAKEQHVANNKKLEEKIDEALSSMKTIIAQVLKKIDKKEKTDKLQNVFNKLAENFVAEATKFKFNANVFLSVAFILLLLAMFGALWFIYHPTPLPKRAGFYAYVAIETLLSGKLFLSITIITSFVYCLRYYAINSHNSVICYQRANTLKSFKALYKNSEKGEEQKMALEKVLETATGHQTTGFAKEQNDGRNSSLAYLLAKTLIWLKPQR